MNRYLAMKDAFEQYWEVVWAYAKGWEGPLARDCQRGRRLAYECCFAIRDRFVFQETLDALGPIERFSQGVGSFEELIRARRIARIAARRTEKGTRYSGAEQSAAWAVFFATGNRDDDWRSTVGLAHGAGLSAAEMQEICERLKQEE